MYHTCTAILWLWVQQCQLLSFSSATVFMCPIVQTMRRSQCLVSPLPLCFLALRPGSSCHSPSTSSSRQTASRSTTRFLHSWCRFTTPSTGRVGVRPWLSVGHVGYWGGCWGGGVHHKNGPPRPTLPTVWQVWLGGSKQWSGLVLVCCQGFFAELVCADVCVNSWGCTLPSCIQAVWVLLTMKHRRGCED